MNRRSAIVRSGHGEAAGRSSASRSERGATANGMTHCQQKGTPARRSSAKPGRLVPANLLGRSPICSDQAGPFAYRRGAGATASSAIRTGRSTTSPAFEPCRPCTPQTEPEQCGTGRFRLFRAMAFARLSVVRVAQIVDRPGRAFCMEADACRSARPTGPGQRCGRCRARLDMTRSDQEALVRRHVDRSRAQPRCMAPSCVPTGTGCRSFPRRPRVTDVSAGPGRPRGRGAGSVVRGLGIDFVPAPAGAGHTPRAGATRHRAAAATEATEARALLVDLPHGHSPLFEAHPWSSSDVTDAAVAAPFLSSRSAVDRPGAGDKGGRRACGFTPTRGCGHWPRGRGRRRGRRPTLRGPGRKNHWRGPVRPAARRQSR